MNSKLKTAIALILVLLTLVSCSPATGNPDGTSADDTSVNDVPAETTAPAQEDLDLVLFDQNTSYLIMRAEETTKIIIDIAADLRKAIDDMTDINKVSIQTDWLKKGTEPDPAALEILIANTNRPESAEAMKDLAYSDFAIKKVGNKVVIAAHTEQTLKQAIDYFLNNLLTAEGEGTNKVLKLKSEYISNSGITDIITSPEQLGEYQIVYPTGNSSMMNAAKDLASEFEAYCGVTIKCVNDRTAATDKEILIGMTSREESAPIKDTVGLDYIIKAVGHKIVIGARSETATGIALDTFVSDFLSGVYSNTFRISSNYDASASGTIVLKDSYDPTLTEGADLRIMSFNILAELWDDKAKETMPGRDKHTVALILSYMPDVVGLQETTALWYSLLEPQLDGIYKFASYTVPNGKTNYSTLMYNIHTTELIECKTTLYTVRNSDNMRHLTWARFRRKSDGAEYIVSCTHWDITHEKRLVQWEENANLINELYAKYKLPIFATGDYNSNEQDLFANFIKKTGMEDPKYVAKTIVNPGKTTHTLGSKASDSELCIDHIAVTPGQDILFYNRLTCPTATDASDHCPIYIDVKLNK